MSAPSKSINVLAAHMYAVTDLGMTMSLASSATSTSSTFSSGIPATIVVISKLSAGSGDLKIDRAAIASSVAFSSPDVTLACSGTSYQVAILDTTSSELVVGLKAEPGGSGMTFSKLAVLVCYEATKGELNAMIEAGVNFMANTTVGDGDGLIDFTGTKPTDGI